MPDSSQALRVAALRLLTRREHSRAELLQKLAGEAESAEQLAAVLDSLQAARLLSDERYARQRVVSRGTRYGNTRLKQELRQQGVADEEIAAALPDAGDELLRCQQVWAKKFPGVAETPAERAKQQRFLQYRGFSSTVIQQVLRGAGEMGDE